MKGFAKVEKSDLLAAIIGFEMKYDAAKELRDKGIRLYYDKHYTNSGRFNRWWNRNKTQMNFVRSRMCAFGTWTDALHDVLTREECDEVDWWCWTSKSEVDPMRALVRATNDGYVLVDDKMASVILKYKTYLESLK